MEGEQRFADFMGGSPRARAPTSDASLWSRLQRTLHSAQGDGAMLLATRFPAAQVQAFRDDHQRSLTHLAALANELELLEFVLESGAPLHAQDDCGAEALTVALLERHWEAAAMLVTYGCDVDHANAILQTPLHVLSTFGALDAVQWLLARGADMELRDASGNSPLHLAAAYCSLPVVELLLAAGADVNALDASRATPLHFAAPNGNCAVVEALLAHGADLEARDDRGNTPLIDAAFVSQSAAPHFAAGDQTTQQAVVALLLQHGANVNATNVDGDSALFGAVRNEYDGLVRLLLTHGADARLRNRQQETVLHVLARGYVSKLAIWRELLRHQADIFAQDRRNLTCAMVWASRHQLSHPEDTSDAGNTQEQTPASAQAWLESLLSREAAVNPAH